MNLTQPHRIARDRSLWSTDHRTLGLRYLLLSLVAVMDGTLMSLAMRVHLVWPDLNLPLYGLVKPEDYLALVTLHGTLMLFFVLTLAPQAGFGNLVLPSQIGAQRMAFPALNAIAFWIMALALAVLIASGFVQGGGAISGWTAYPPLSAIASAGPGQGLGMDLWLSAITLFCISSILNAVNFLATIIAHRCGGMSWGRLPLTVWAWFTAALLTVLAFGVLLAAALLLFLDRHAGTSFYIPAGDLVNGTLHAHGDGSPLLWLHLFWFFGHPEVYIAILPGMGLTSMVLSNFSRRRVFGYPMMIATTLLIGGLGILVWGHHMFVAGLNPFAGTAFSISTMVIAIPSAAKVLSWLATVWRSRPRYTTAMLFALGFVSLFVAGGLTGPILAQPILDQYLHQTYFVVGHFHLIMAMAGIFGLFCATCYWFPLMTGRHLDERLGRWHFWLSIIGAYATFLPMHIAGLMGAPRHYAQWTGLPAASTALLSRAIPMQVHITYAAFLLIAAQVLFLYNVWRSWNHGTPAAENPWDATTLEWRPTSPREVASSLSVDPHASYEEIKVFRGPCVYSERPAARAAIPQWSNPEIPE